MIDHTSKTETWETYLTTDNNEVSVQYINNKLESVGIKIRPAGGTLTFDSLEQAQQVLTAFHAALAGISKKEANNGPQE